MGTQPKQHKVSICFLFIYFCRARFADHFGIKKLKFTIKKNFIEKILKLVLNEKNLEFFGILAITQLFLDLFWTKSIPK